MSVLQTEVSVKRESTVYATYDDEIMNIPITLTSYLGAGH